MLALTVVTLLLSGAPAPADLISLASPGFTTVQMAPQLGAFYADHFAQQLALQRGLSVITGSEIQSLLGFERQKQLLGCADDSTSCLAELAGALGVEALITGNVGRVGSRYVVNIKILSSRDGRALSVHSGQLKNEDALLDFLNLEAKRAAANLRRELGRTQAVAAAPKPEPSPGVDGPTVTEVQPASGPGLSPGVLVVGATGGALLVSGGILLGLSASAHQRLVSGEDVIADLDGHLAQGRLFRALGYAGMGLGVAGLGLATVMALTGDEQPVTAAVVPVRGGAVAVLEGGLSW